MPETEYDASSDFSESERVVPVATPYEKPPPIPSVLKVRPEYKPRPTGINRANYDKPATGSNIKKFLKPTDEAESFEIGPMFELAKPTPEPSLGDILTAKSEPAELPPLELEQPRKLTEREKLDIRYKNAFGSQYTGDPNIKQKDYKKMIQEQERIKKSSAKLEKESKKKSKQ